MKIAIDISQVMYGTGVSVYTQNLVENLLKIDTANKYILFGGSLRRFKELNSLMTSIGVTVHGNSKLKLYPIPPTMADLIWNKLHILPIEALTGKVDVFHSSDWTQPPSEAFKVTTIHDLVPLKYPEISHPSVTATHKARLKWVVKEVDRVIVPSKITAADVAELGIDKNKIRIIPEAVDPDFIPATSKEVETIKRKYKITGKYLLAVGVNPRKNTERIISAFKMLKNSLNLKLVVIGYSNKEKPSESDVIYTGHVPKSELSAFYSGTEALVYPSLYEGFGIPILEAFTCNIPIVTSKSSSTAEVAGEAAVLVDPESVDSIAEGISGAIRNREKLIKLGTDRVKQFSWEKTVKETLKIYEESTA